MRRTLKTHDHETHDHETHAEEAAVDTLKKRADGRVRGHFK